MSPSASARRSRKRRGPLASLFEILVTVAVAIGLALLVETFIAKPYKIPSLSMYPTLRVGQRILVNRLDTHPAIGDVVVFHPPTGAPSQTCGDGAQGPGHAAPCDRATAGEASTTFVKRVVGLPGDHLLIRGGYVYRDGVRENGSYIDTTQCARNNECSFSREITVPAGDYYMMGDNRGNSDDSRYWGPIPQRYIIGVAIFTYWPLDRIGTL